MLNLFRRHGRDCGPKLAPTKETPNPPGEYFAKRSTSIPAPNGGFRNAGWCPSKPQCFCFFEGTDGTGAYHKPKNVIDPRNGQKVRDWSRASEIVRDLDTPKPVLQDQTPVTSLETAIDGYRDKKSKRSEAVRGKTRRILERMKKFLWDNYRIETVQEVRLPHLTKFAAGWPEAHSVQRNNQTIVKAFWNFCVDSDFISKSPAKGLDPIPEDRVQVVPFTQDEMMRIFKALPLLHDEYGRCGGDIEIQTKAFVYVMRWTGMSIGDTTTLEKEEVTGWKILTARTKTNENVYGAVPQFVIDALKAAPHDSRKYFFWTGEGKAHSRTNKWGERLQRLFVLADVKTREVQKYKYVGGKRTSEKHFVKISDAKPHMFRHTMARDLIMRGCPLTELAKLLGNSLKTIEKYYGAWEQERQNALDKRLEDWWSVDPITKMLMNASQ
jgi:integrase